MWSDTGASSSSEEWKIMSESSQNRLILYSMFDSDSSSDVFCIMTHHQLCLQSRHTRLSTSFSVNSEMPLHECKQQTFALQRETPLTRECLDAIIYWVVELLAAYSADSIGADSF